jgi:hypothetical protein
MHERISFYCNIQYTRFQIQMMKLLGLTLAALQFTLNLAVDSSVVDIYVPAECLTHAAPGDHLLMYNF